jgi:hypothetical protein
MCFLRPIQWYHSQAAPIWPDGTFNAQSMPVAQVYPPNFANKSIAECNYPMIKVDWLVAGVLL